MRLGFIILRNVRCQITNTYWIECYESLRKYYPDNKIIIIDDNSNYEFITKIVLENTIVIDSEYKGRGELLPYIYYLRDPCFDTAVIIHDSVFVKERVEFDKVNLPLWNFDTQIQDRNLEINLITKLNNMQALLDLYETDKWNGCFGGMSIITIDFLRKINSKYHLENLIPFVTCRLDRMALERVLGLIFTSERSLDELSVFGNIFKYCRWGYSYPLYLHQKKYDILPNIPLIKVWTGR